MDGRTSGRRSSSFSLTRPSIDGDWRVRESGSDAYKSSLLYATSHVPLRQQRVSFADERGERERLPRSSSSQSNSTSNSDEDGTKTSGSDGALSDGRATQSEHAAMNAKRMSMDPAPYDFNDPMFSTDEFRVWEMKIRNCPKSRPHDWTCCPFAHPGEKAKRRDPRLFSYCGTACADYRKTGSCARGDSCMYAHGVFECWLHPSRYRTQLCTDGEACNRRVCFFAHRECELRKPVGGQIAAIPQPGMNSLESLGMNVGRMGVNGMNGINGVNGINGMTHVDIAEVQRRASMGAMPLGVQPPLPQHRPSEPSSSSLSAAIQMLDPVSKHRLLEALQNDLHETVSQSSFFGAGSAPQQDSAAAAMKSAQMADSQSLLEAIQQLQLGTRMSRHSLDDITPILSGHGGVGARHASGLPQYNQAHQYLNSITSSRRSVDIGAVSRLGSGGNSFSADFHSRQVQPQAGGSPPPRLPTGRLSMDGIQRNIPNDGSVKLGGLYESSGPSVGSLNSAQAAMMHAFASAEGALGSRGSSDPFGQPPMHHGSSNAGTRRPSISEDPRISLSKIAENPNACESEGTGSSGSSSVATAVRSSSEASSMAAHPNNGTFAANNTTPKKFQREFSVDNLLAELPRSASQVDLVSGGHTTS